MAYQISGNRCIPSRIPLWTSFQVLVTAHMGAYDVHQLTCVTLFTIIIHACIPQSCVDACSVHME